MFDHSSSFNALPARLQDLIAVAGDGRFLLRNDNGPPELVEYESLEDIAVRASAAVRPPERLTVSESAERYRYLNNPGSFVGEWDNDFAPYLVEPMDLLTSVSYTAMVFVGPAQSGKTDMVLNWVGHSVKCDPTDMTIYSPRHTDARDFSIRRVDKLMRHSPQIGEHLLWGHGDNVYDKRFDNGMLLALSYAAIGELSGRPIPRTWLTDYDRMPQNVDDEGAPFDLARKRTTTFRSHGMTVAESSPGHPIDNPKWARTSPHEAPPTKGILGLYNRGDRRLFYWQCVSCGHAFEGSFKLFQWKKSRDLVESAESAFIPCPKCGQVYTQHPDLALGVPGRDGLNLAGRWIQDGMIWRPDGRIVGKPIRSDIASFWLKGPAAALTDWKTLVLNYLKAVEEYERSGDEQPLKTTINVDQGEAYTPKNLESTRLPEDLKARSKALGVRVVPPGVRFLIASIDVQKNRFDVQIHGFGINGEIWIIDRYKVQRSARVDDDGEHLWVNPGANLEDWYLLKEQVLEKSYPLGDGSGREMAMRYVVCDSGGREGSTANAYNFWRHLRDDNETPNLHRRFLLVKGASEKTAPRTAVRFPDSERKDRHAGARGEIPVLFINTDQMKDMADKALERTEPGGRRVNFPEWLDINFYIELTVETKTIKGWENPKSFRNESWDLLVYAMSCAICNRIGIEQIDWADPPSWAKEWDENDLVFESETESPVVSNAKVSKRKRSLSELAEALA